MNYWCTAVQGVNVRINYGTKYIYSSATCTPTSTAVHGGMRRCLNWIAGTDPFFLFFLEKSVDRSPAYCCTYSSSIVKHLTRAVRTFKSPLSIRVASSISHHFWLVVRSKTITAVLCTCTDNDDIGKRSIFYLYISTTRYHARCPIRSRIIFVNGPF